MKCLYRMSAALVAFAASSSAMAADPRVKAPPAPPPVVAPAYNWTGFYVGGHAGWAWTDTTSTDPRANQNLISNNGIGGGQVGYNWQIGTWVLGVEAQASWTHAQRGRTVLGICQLRKEITDVRQNC
jgi:outer membrane immunogenic protein